MMKEKISLVGLGKLGLPLLACMAKAGYETIGVDIEADVVDAVNRGESPIPEPGLDELIALYGGKQLVATLDHGRAIRETDITYILTATPSNPDGSFSNRHVEAALTALSKAFSSVEKDYHLFVISSTVVPGSTMDSFVPLIEKQSGKKLNKDFGVAFDPDFVALGSVVKDFLNPDLVIIGETERRAGEIVENIHKRMCENKPKVSRMSIINAELAKVCLNAYVTTKITFANTIANLCERIPGADCDQITSGIGDDKRISPYYFSGGLSFGGTCFPRDTKAFKQIARKYGLEPSLMEAVDVVNDFQDQNLVAATLRELESCANQSVGILGLAFKECTPVITQSPAIKLIQSLLDRGISVVAYDPMANDAAKVLFEGQIEFVNSAEALLGMCGLCVVTYRSKAFKIAIENYSATQKIKVLDCWRTVDPGTVHEGVSVVFLGRS
jgi:UDPglucose 6-dehydrogenase